jgi:hypothetical protein
MRRPIALLSAGFAGLVAVAAGPPSRPPATPPALPTPTYSITLGARHACVTPYTRWRARADGGVIDVATPAPNTLAVAMTGAPAADSYLGCTSSAAESFQLVQEFEVTSSDPSAREVVLTLDSALVGYVRSRRNAGACVRLASACVTPASWDNSPLSIAHPLLCVSGDGARLCNQHLPPLQGPPMPVGRYTLTAHFVLDATASGVCNAHAAADFSPDTALPADWVRTRDPFQGASKKAFGFSLTLTAAPPSGRPSIASAPATRPLIRRAEYARPVAGASPRPKEGRADPKSSDQTPR